MPMHIEHQDIVEIGTEKAEVIVLWANSDLPELDDAWKQLMNRHADRITPITFVSQKMPWRCSENAYMFLRVPQKPVKWVVVLANQDDCGGCETLDEVTRQVSTCLDLLSSRGVESVAFNHIPLRKLQSTTPPFRLDAVLDDQDVFGPGWDEGRHDDTAQAMADAAKRWLDATSGPLTTIYLVDPVKFAHVKI